MLNVECWVDGKPGGRAKSRVRFRLTVLTTIFSVRVSGHTRPACHLERFVHALGLLWRTRAVAGEKEHAVLAAAVSKRATHTTLIKSFSVSYLVKMASSKLFLCFPSFDLFSTTWAGWWLAVYTTLFLSLHSCSMHLGVVADDWLFFLRHILQHVWMPMVNEREIRSAAHLLNKLERKDASLYGVDMSCTHSHFVLWNEHLF